LTRESAIIENILIGEDEMQAIKNFLYLDEYKMYSISSQIFEGITASLTDSRITTKEETEEQRGPFVSGRTMADIMRTESGLQERKYLHDYSYSLFESRLRDEGRVLSISLDSLASSLESISDATFVSIKARAAFNDLNVIKSTIASYNKIGEALTYLSNSDEIEQKQQDLSASLSANRDRNRQARIQRQQKDLDELIKQTARSSGLHVSPSVIEHLGFLLDYGFQDLFEVRMLIEDYIFSACLKRECFRESEQLIVRKYSRFSEKDFVLFGTVAQSSDLPENDDIGPETGSGDLHLSSNWIFTWRRRPAREGRMRVGPDH